MGSLPARLVLFIVGIAALAVVALAVAVARVPVHRDRATALIAVLLAALVLLARLFPVQVTPKTKTTVATAPLYAAALLLPVPVAIVTGAFGAMLGESARRAPWFQVTFNTAEAAVRVAAGAAVFELLAGTDGLGSPVHGRWPAGVIPAAVTMYLLNSVLVESVVGVQLRRFSLRAFLHRRAADLPREAALFTLGLLVTGVGVLIPWAMVLLAVVLILVHRSLSTPARAAAGAHARPGQRD